MKIISCLCCVIFVFCVSVGCDGKAQKTKKVTFDDFRQYVRSGDLKRVEGALGRGFYVNTVGIGGANALFEADNFDMVKLLVDRDIEVNQQKLLESDGSTPLHIYCISGADPRIIKLLLDSGADPTIKDSSGKTALDYAVRYSKSE